MVLGCMSNIRSPLPSFGSVQKNLRSDKEKDKRNDVWNIQRIMDFDFVLHIISYL